MKAIEAKINSLRIKVDELSALLAARREINASNRDICIEMEYCVRMIDAQQKELERMRMSLEQKMCQIDNHVSKLMRMIKVIRESHLAMMWAITEVKTIQSFYLFF